MFPGKCAKIPTFFSLKNSNNMKTTIISINTHVGNDSNKQQMMTSLEIAELTGKQHNHLMRDIRNMERAWEKVAQSKFGLGSYKDLNGQLRPCYLLTKTECLYIATKFNDEDLLFLDDEIFEASPSPSQGGGVETPDSVLAVTPLQCYSSQKAVSQTSNISPRQCLQHRLPEEYTN